MQALLSWVTTSIGGPLGWLAGILLNFLWGKAETAITKEVAQQKSDADIDAERNAAAKAELDAKTKADLDAADDALINGL